MSDIFESRTLPDFLEMKFPILNGGDVVCDWDKNNRLGDFHLLFSGDNIPNMAIDKETAVKLRDFLTEYMEAR